MREPPKFRFLGVRRAGVLYPPDKIPEDIVDRIVNAFREVLIEEPARRRVAQKAE